MLKFTKKVFLDFETFSKISLKECGAYKYSRHESTEILSLAYKFSESDNIHMWSPSIPREYPSLPKNICWALQNGYSFVAHNAAFEWCIWNELGHRFLGFPYLPLDQVEDTMASCGSHALPLSLEGAGKALSLPITKDISGEKLAILMSMPDTKILRKLKIVLAKQEDLFEKVKQEVYENRIWGPISVDILRKYNSIDVLVTESIYNTLGPLIPVEQKIWEVTVRTNYRGVPVDVSTVGAAIDLAAGLSDKYTAEIQQLTDGQIASGNQVGKIKEYLLINFGIEVDSLDKFAVEKLIKNTSIPEKARRILQLRQILGKSSIAKYKTIIDRVCNLDSCKPDEIGTVHDNLIYHAASTGRWISKGIQLHNQTKYSYKVAGDTNLDYRLNLIAEFIRTRNINLWELAFKDPTKALAGFVRSCFGDRKYAMVCGDFSSVEARCVFWLAGEQKALDAYRDGKDLYVDLASSIFKKPIENVTRDERNNFGKPGILGSGYGMGGPKMADKIQKETDINIDIYGKDLIKDRIESSDFSLFDYCYLMQYKAYADKDLTAAYHGFLSDAIQTNFDSIYSNAENYNYARAFGIAIIHAYRSNYPKVPEYWKALEVAVKQALLTNTTTQVGQIIFIPSDRFLYIQLPSGRRLAYANARIENEYNKFGKESQSIVYDGVDQKTHQWVRQHTFGGSLTENISSGFCRDLLAWAMLSCEKAGFRTLFTVHDELVSMGDDLESFLKLLTTLPPWAEDFPIAAEGWKGYRYHK